MCPSPTFIMSLATPATTGFHATDSNIREAIFAYVCPALVSGNPSDFYNNTSLDEWNTSQVTDMSSLFVLPASDLPCTNFTTFNDFGLHGLSKWDLSSVTRTDSMFANMQNFNLELDWDFSNVETMSNMFENAVKFNNGGRDSIGHWNTAKIINMDDAFRGAKAFEQDLSGWDVANVRSMTDIFKNAVRFDLNSTSFWDTSSVVVDTGSFKPSCPKGYSWEQSLEFPYGNVVERCRNLLWCDEKIKLGEYFVMTETSEGAANQTCTIDSCAQEPTFGYGYTHPGSCTILPCSDQSIGYEYKTAGSCKKSRCEKLVARYYTTKGTCDHEICENDIGSKDEYVRAFVTTPEGCPYRKVSGANIQKAATGVLAITLLTALSF